MPKDTPVDDIDANDRALFRDSVRGTTPLGEVIPPSAVPPERIQESDPVDYPPLSDHISVEVTGDTELSFKRGGISNELMHRLKKGKVKIDGELDLHGATVEEARAMVQGFLVDAAQANCHYVRIIHGRGSHGGDPILKNLVNSWLRQLPQILAFCSAPRHDGGTGAVYVLLRR